MKIPSEEIVTAWLQECKGYFTMNNIKVPKKGGGMGAEIDILGTNKRINIWVEISVSTNPRCNHKKEIRFRETLKDYLKDFARADKRKKVAKYFGKKYDKWWYTANLRCRKKKLEDFQLR